MKTPTYFSFLVALLVAFKPFVQASMLRGRIQEQRALSDAGPRKEAVGSGYRRYLQRVLPDYAEEEQSRKYLHEEATTEIENGSGGGIQEEIGARERNRGLHEDNGDVACKITGCRRRRVEATKNLNTVKHQVPTNNFGGPINGFRGAERRSLNYGREVIRPNAENDNDRRSVYVGRSRVGNLPRLP